MNKPETQDARQRSVSVQKQLEPYISAIAGGDKTALATLYGETKTAVYGFALSILRNGYDAEDVLQEVYVRIWEAAPEYRPMGKPMAWILTITRNLATGVLRERMKTAEMPEEDFLLSPQNLIANTEERMVLEDAMSLISQSERQIILLHAVSGLKHIEIAKLLELPLATVLSKYSRARKKLQKIIEGGELLEEK